MTISSHIDTFMGKSIERFTLQTQQINPDVSYKLMSDYGDDTPFEDYFKALVKHPHAHRLTSLVIGMWDEDMSGGSASLIADLAAAKDQLVQLRGLFLGDITYEEFEISWITQSDISPLYAAYPQLEILRVRGNEGLSLGEFKHANLREFAIESGGLGAKLIQQVCQAELPQLEHLELWLGSENYGWNGELDDLQPILRGELFPHLRYLGLRDCERADELAALLVTAPIIERIETLDLSLGNLGDAGATALLQLPTDKLLKKLDIDHHYVSTTMLEKLKALPFEVIAGHPEDVDEDDGEEFRYIAVSE